MGKFWTGLGLAFAGLILILMFPISGTEAYTDDGPVWPWIGWILFVAGIAVVAFVAIRGKRRRRR